MMNKKTELNVVKLVVKTTDTVEYFIPRDVYKTGDSLDDVKKKIQDKNLRMKKGSETKGDKSLRTSELSDSDAKQFMAAYFQPSKYPRTSKKPVKKASNVKQSSTMFGGKK